MCTLLVGPVPYWWVTCITYRRTQVSPWHLELKIAVIDIGGDQSLPETLGSHCPYEQTTHS